MPDQDGNLNRHLYAQTHQHGRDDRHHHHHRHHHQHSDRHHDHAKVQCPPDPFPEDVTAPPKDVSDTSPKPPSRLPSNLSCGSREADWNWCPGRLQIISQGDPQKRELAIICLRGKEQKVCRRSLFIFSLNSCFRRHVIELVNWFLFDKFILSLIIFNSLCLASYDYRSESDSGFNWISDNVFDPILTCFFTLEFVLKVIAFGFVLDETSYLRDAWNWLDFIVVVTGILQMTNAMTSTEGVGFLRMFRILRPLRSLNAVPQMKVLVNTVLSSVPRLGNVTLMAAFLFVSFGILGISLFGGVFYRSCRSIAQPLLLGSNGTECWSWPYTGEERLCGGRYLCEDSPLGQKGHCGGHPQDTNEEFRPVFDGGQRGFPWCSGSEPRKVFPESEWISFDHLGTALITIFQCMTLEGWTDVMYRIQDGYGFAVATIYFFLLIPVTSFFLLNVALAVVDEAREDFAVEAEEEALEEEALQHLAAEAIEESEVTIGSASRASRVSKMHAPRASGWMGQLVDAAEDVTRAMSKALDAEQVEEEEVPWLDTAVVRILRYIATSEAFTNLIMLFIALNVVTMMLDGYPPILELQDFLATCEIVFLVIFCIEMCILLGAYGPCRYVRTPAMCFDGIIVTVSVVQVLTSPDGQGGPFTALRTFRLFRVLNKLASRWPSFRVLLKAMLYTGKSLSYWIVLFSLVLYICTLMFMQLFNRKFHFLDVDSLAEVGPDQGQAWCEGTDGLAEPFRQDCIPRANFDTFLWSLVSIFQIMTGENWNAIMYAGMRAQGWAFGGFFVGLIVFGQILFLSLFLSMLLSKFDEVQDEMEQKEAEKMSKSKNDVGTHSLRSLFRAVSTLRKIETWRDAGHEKKVAPVGEETTSDMKPVVPKAAGMEALGELPEGESSNSLKRTLVWPRGYALCIFSENHAVRRLCKGILSFEVQIQGDRFKVFDNAILVCILVSCIGMASDTPLADPKATLTQIIRGGDYVFAVLFGAEMIIKLVAFGLIFSENAYLKDGWNILDGVVVIVSIVDLAVAGGGGFLKGVRILRAFRPLRIISRNQNLRVVAQTIFASLQDLLSLMVVAALFLLIFALFACSFLSGRMYHCSTETSVLLLRDQADFRTPLCLGPLENLGSVVSGSCANGALNGQAWQENSCVNCHSTLNVSGARATVDTPICVGRCDPSIVPEEVGRQQPPEWLCPKPLTSVQQLPSVCDNRDSAEYLSNITSDELQGREYMQAMSRMLVIPCGGSTVNASGGFVEPGAVVSCREAFCSEGVSSEVAQQCRVNCQGHPFFCKESCEADEQSGTCQSCRRECEAACECSNFCEPLIKDAALCVEQGGRWQQALSQDFDNVFSSMLTLFEISSTEGWADVMYAACDSVGHFIEPIRNYSEWMFAPFFVVYMIFSNMFIINLSVGVIVDKFMDLKQSGKRDVILTSAQVKWLDSQKLLSRTRFFDVQDLDMMPSLQRKAYDIISSFRFTTFIMVAIALNSALMAMQTFPSQIEWWADVMYVGKRVFSGIFTLEMMLKFYALRCTYFEDSWNRFDFFCVVVSLLGIVLEDTTTLNVTGVTFVFRVLRLFRLMKYLRGVKKIFAALAASVPKLVNVMAILLLLLTLYSILGVSLFSTLKFSSENAQCNFKDFVQAFITLFRASTGEAWNEIMHDIARSPRQIFASGDWCTPDYLFDPENHFEVLSEKCLIERPNGCVNSWIMGQLMPLTYWVTYTLIVAIMVMNLVIAVILESYEEGKGEKDTEIVEHCVKLWKQRDTDLKMYLPMEEAIAYIAEALNYGMELHQEENRMPIAMPELISKRLTEVPMKFINTLDLPCTEDGKVYFWHALVQVLKLLCHRWDPTLINEINSLEACVRNTVITAILVAYVWASERMIQWVKDFLRESQDVPCRNTRVASVILLIVVFGIYGIIYVSGVAGLISFEMEHLGYTFMGFSCKVTLSILFASIRAYQNHQVLARLVGKLRGVSVAFVSLLRGSFDHVVPCAVSPDGMCHLPERGSRDFQDLERFLGKTMEESNNFNDLLDKDDRERFTNYVKNAVRQKDQSFQQMDAGSIASQPPVAHALHISLQRDAVLVHLSLVPDGGESDRRGNRLAAFLALQITSQESEWPMDHGQMRDVEDKVTDVPYSSGTPSTDDVSTEGHEGQRISLSGTRDTEDELSATISLGEAAKRSNVGKNISNNKRRKRDAKLLVKILQRRLRRKSKKDSEGCETPVADLPGCPGRVPRDRQSDCMSRMSDKTNIQKVSFTCGGSDVLSQSSKMSAANSVMMACRQLLGPLHDALPPSGYMSRRVEDHLQCSAEMVQLKASCEISRHSQKQKMDEWKRRHDAHQPSVMLEKSGAPGCGLPEQLWRSEVLENLNESHPGPRPKNVHIPTEEELWHKAWMRTYAESESGSSGEGEDP